MDLALERSSGEYFMVWFSLGPSWSGLRYNLRKLLEF